MWSQIKNLCDVKSKFHEETCKNKDIFKLEVYNEDFVQPELIFSSCCSLMILTEINQTWKIKGKQYIVQFPAIGSGSYGKVYKAFDQSSRKIIAIKQMKSSNWQQEIKALKRIQHQNVIKYIDHFVDDNRKSILIIMEYFQGVTLNRKIEIYQQIVKQEGLHSNGLPEETVLAIAVKLAQGFQLIHQKGFSHCDIKPQNILVNNHGQVKIIDFGLASNSEIAFETGTLIYTPPEILEPAQSTSQKSRDVWSLGLVIYEMLTGKRYFQRLIEKPIKRDDLIRLILKETKQGLKIDYSKEYSNFWKLLTEQMLKFDSRQRNTMKKIRIKLEIYEQQKMFRNAGKNPLIEKAKQTFEDNQFDESLSAEQILQSEGVTVKIIHYLDFFYKKYLFLPEFCYFLAHQRHPFSPNSFKYSLIFLSLSLYTKSIHELLEKLKKQKLRIDFENDSYSEQIVFDYIAKPDVDKIISVFQCYIQYYTEEYDNYQSLLHNKIIPSLKHSLSQNKYQFISDKIQNRLKHLILDTEERAMIPRQKFIDCANLLRENQANVIKLTKKQMDKFLYSCDVTVLYLTMMISRYDQFFKTSRTISLDNISKLYSNILNSRRKTNTHIDSNRQTKREFIEQIVKYKNCD